MTWVVEAVFQFADQTVERQELWRGDRDTAERLARRIEEKSQLGIRGIRYDGARTERPVGVYVATGQAE